MALVYAAGRLAEGECLAVNAVAVSSACPAGFNTTRELSFTVTSEVAGSRPLGWRRAAGSANFLTPDSGTLASAGRTTVSTRELVFDNQSVIEIVRGQDVLATLTVKSQ
jgi:hypothetical protein